MKNQLALPAVTCCKQRNYPCVIGLNPTCCNHCIATQFVCFMENPDRLSKLVAPTRNGQQIISFGSQINIQELPQLRHIMQGGRWYGKAPVVSISIHHAT